MPPIYMYLKKTLGARNSLIYSRKDLVMSKRWDRKIRASVVGEEPDETKSYRKSRKHEPAGEKKKKKPHNNLRYYNSGKMSQ